MLPDHFNDLLSIPSDNSASTLLEQFACATLLCNQTFPLDTVLSFLSSLRSIDLSQTNRRGVVETVNCPSSESTLLSPCLAMTLCPTQLTVVHQADALPCMPMPSMDVMLCRISHGIAHCPEFAPVCWMHPSANLCLVLPAKVLDDDDFWMMM